MNTVYLLVIVLCSGAQCPGGNATDVHVEQHDTMSSCVAAIDEYKKTHTNIYNATCNVRKTK